MAAGVVFTNFFYFGDYVCFVFNLRYAFLAGESATENERT